MRVAVTGNINALNTVSGCIQTVQPRGTRSAEMTDVADVLMATLPKTRLGSDLMSAPAQTDSAAASDASSVVDVGDMDDTGPLLRQAQGLTLHLLRQACHASCAQRLSWLRSAPQRAAS